jgi:hypothetical protein
MHHQAVNNLHPYSRVNFANTQRRQSPARTTRTHPHNKFTEELRASPGSIAQLSLILNSLEPPLEFIGINRAI